MNRRPEKMYWVELEDPPRHRGDTAVALLRLMKLVKDRPFRLRVSQDYHLYRAVRIVRYEAWPV